MDDILADRFGTAVYDDNVIDDEGDDEVEPVITESIDPIPERHWPARTSVKHPLAVAIMNELIQA